MCDGFRSAYGRTDQPHGMFSIPNGPPFGAVSGLPLASRKSTYGLVSKRKSEVAVGSPNTLPLVGSTAHVPE